MHALQVELLELLLVRSAGPFVLRHGGWQLTVGLVLIDGLSGEAGGLGQRVGFRRLVLTFFWLRLVISDGWAASIIIYRS